MDGYQEHIEYDEQYYTNMTQIRFICRCSTYDGQNQSDRRQHTEDLVAAGHSTIFTERALSTKNKNLEFQWFLVFKKDNVHCSEES